MMSGKLKPLASAGAAALLLAGCAVTPQKLTDAEVTSFSERNLRELAAGQEPLSGPVSLYEAMARALKYNLDYRVAQMKQALAIGDAKLKSWEALPKLLANGHWGDRNNDPGGWSRSLTTGIRSADASRSSERQTLAGDLTFTWNILDFGLSWVRARQAADEALIAMEQKRRAINRVIEEVRTTFWRAASAQRLVGRLNRLAGRVDRALRNARRLARGGETTPMEALTFERELVAIRKQAVELTRDLHGARIQLAALMNLAPGTRYKLAIPRRRAAVLKLPRDPRQLMAMALRNRPELRVAAYRERINQKEATAALLEMLPGINLYAGLNGDLNPLLFNASWISWGARLSWNLLRVFRYPARKATIDARDRLLKAQSLAMTMAVLTQVHVARLRYHYQRQVLASASRYHDVQRRILRQVRAAAAADIASEQSLIREEMNTIVAAAKHDVAYADLQNAAAQLYASVGLDPYGAGAALDMRVKELAASLRRAQNGDRLMKMAQSRKGG